MSAVFVAEVSSNHNRDINRCLAFIDKAAQIGCEVVKFQLFKIRELFAPEILADRKELLKRQEWELPVDFLPVLSARCREVNIKFACTPFYLGAVGELLPYVDFYKVASYELLWNDLLKACAQTGKPVVLSTGMATLKEVRSAVRILVDSGCKDLTLLHCVSGYPAPVDECNLAAIETMRNKIKVQDPKVRVKFGWSDHSVNPGVIYRAVHRWDAGMIEFHLDLDGQGEEYKTGHCWLPHHIQDVIVNVKRGLAADGSGIKSPIQTEMTECEWRADPSDGLRPLLSTRNKRKGQHG